MHSATLTNFCIILSLQSAML